MLSKLSVSFILAVAYCLNTVAGAQDIVITAGVSTGSYYSLSSVLKKELRRQNLLVEIIPSVGSLENLERLSDSEHPANIGLTQADTLKHYLANNYKFARNMLVLGEIGKECVFIIAGNKYAIYNDDDLQQDNGQLMAISHPKSGVAITYQYMTSLEPKFQHTPARYMDGLEALAEIQLGSEYNPIKALMLVMHPKTMFPEVEWVLRNINDYRFVTVDDWDLNDKLPDGSSLYTYEDVNLSGTLLPEKEKYLALGKEYDIEVETICTKGLLIAAKNKLDRTQKIKLNKAVRRARDKLRLD